MVLRRVMWISWFSLRTNYEVNHGNEAFCISIAANFWQRCLQSTVDPFKPRICTIPWPAAQNSLPTGISPGFLMNILAKFEIAHLHPIHLHLSFFRNETKGSWKIRFRMGKGSAFSRGKAPYSDSLANTKKETIHSFSPTPGFSPCSLSQGASWSVPIENQSVRSTV